MLRHLFTALLLFDPFFHARAAEDPSPAAAPTGRRATQNPAAGAASSNVLPADPLKPFLSSWMSKGDYDLLIRSKDRNPKGLGKDGLLERLTEKSHKEREDNWKQNLRVFPQDSSIPADNPYLKNLNEILNLSPQKQAKPLDKAQAQNTIKDSQEQIQPAAQEPKKEPSEELKTRLKQKDDKKYFPQLKRF